ncbi:hypothetical protein D3C87_1166610 [compost metagenome]
MRHVQPGQVHQLERAHAETGLLAHDVVDIDELGHAFLGDLQPFDVHATAGVVDDESRHVLAAHRRVTHAARQLHQLVTDGGVARQAVDDLDHLHQRHRVEEVVAHHAARVPGAHGDGRDRQRRGVRRDHRVFPDDGFQLGDQVALDLELLHDGFQHHVAAGQVFQRVARLHAGQRGLAVGGADLALVGQLGERVLQVLARSGHGLGVDVEQVDRQARLCGNLGNTAAHGARADDAERLNRGLAHRSSKKVVVKLARSYDFCIFRDSG